MPTLDQLLSSSWQSDNEPTSQLAPVAAIHASHLALQSDSPAGSCPTYVQDDNRWAAQKMVHTATEGLGLPQAPTSTSRSTGSNRENSATGEQEAGQHLLSRSPSEILPVEFITTSPPYTKTGPQARRTIKSHTTKHYHHQKRVRQQAMVRQLSTSRSVQGLSEPQDVASGTAAVSNLERTRESLDCVPSTTVSDPGSEDIFSVLHPDHDAEDACNVCGFAHVLGSSHTTTLTPPLTRSICGGFISSTPYSQVTIEPEMYETLAYCECRNPITGYQTHLSRVRNFPAEYQPGNLQSRDFTLLRYQTVSGYLHFRFSLPVQCRCFAILHRYLAQQRDALTHLQLQQLATSNKQVATALRYLSTATKLLQNTLNCPDDALSIQSVTATLLLCSFSKSLQNDYHVEWSFSFFIMFPRIVGD